MVVVVIVVVVVVGVVAAVVVVVVVFYYLASFHLELQTCPLNYAMRRRRRSSSSRSRLVVVVVVVLVVVVIVAVVAAVLVAVVVIFYYLAQFSLCRIANMLLKLRDTFSSESFVCPKTHPFLMTLSVKPTNQPTNKQTKDGVGGCTSRLGGWEVGVGWGWGWGKSVVIRPLCPAQSSRHHVQNKEHRNKDCERLHQQRDTQSAGA